MIVAKLAWPLGLEYVFKGKFGMNKVLFAMLLLFSSLMFPPSVLAEPELKGSAEVLSSFLDGMPKVVTIAASATEKVAAKKAVMNLLVETEEDALAEALRKNAEIRKKVRSVLSAEGILAADIRESKFSSIPEYGFFGNEPDSYRVSNVLSVGVTSEAQMIAVAEASDQDQQVRYVSSSAKVLDREAVKHQLLKEALLIAKKKAALYEAELGIKLEPAEFQEDSIRFVEQAPLKRRAQSVASSYVASAPATTSFGETEFTLSIHVQYKLKPL